MIYYLLWTYWILLAEYCNADRTTWKLTLQDINTTLKELKTERDCSHRQLFRPLWGSSVWRNNQRSGYDEKLSAHSDFSPDPELLTPTESRHTTCLLGGKSPSVKLMSRRENKELAKTNLKNMDKAKNTAYRIYKRSTAQTGNVLRMIMKKHLFDV